MTHVYSDGFFDYIDAESYQSAQRLIDAGLGWLKPTSVLDVGCGRGAWLRHWIALGVGDVSGVDGEFVDRAKLHFPASAFVAKDLSKPFRLERKFDLVQSLEVAEHLPASAAEDFVDSLCAHGDVVLFSAAVPGQGGEMHLNERPPDYWRALFAARSYLCFDCVRSKVSGDPSVKPWYRYNTLLYVRAERVADLPDAVRRTEVAEGAPVPEVAPLPWRLRRILVSAMPRVLVTAIAKINAWANVRLKAGRSSAG